MCATISGPVSIGRRNMVKRFAAVIVAAVIMLLPFTAMAEAKYPLTFERAKAFMNVNNVDLKKLARDENDALGSYQRNADQAKLMDTEGFTVTFNGEDYFMRYNPETKLMMRKVKELYPEQMKFSWEATRNTRIITENKMTSTLRGIFFGVYNASEDVKLKQMQLDLAAKVNGQDKLKLDRGLITTLAKQESDFNLKKAQNDLIVAKRNYENAVRSYNQFAGLPAKTQYTDIVNEDVLTKYDWKPVDYYIEQALANRFDITGIRKQIALKEQEKSITEDFSIYKNSTTAQDEYESLLYDIEQLELDLESMKLTITDEIKNAYVDVLQAGKSVDSMNNTLKLQQSNFSKMQARYKAGLISENALDQAEIGLKQVENGYNARLFDYNTKIMRFNDAVGIGPGY